MSQKSRCRNEFRSQLNLGERGAEDAKDAAHVSGGKREEGVRRTNLKSGWSERGRDSRKVKVPSLPCSLHSAAVVMICGTNSSCSLLLCRSAESFVL